MDKSTADAYVYAKACGILAKSFTGKKASRLFECQSLSSLWTLLFNTPVPQVPEKLLAQQIEEEAFSRFLTQYIKFVDCYTRPKDILIDQLAIYEAENLKEVGGALCDGQKECPPLINLGKMSRLNFKAYPDIKKITKDSLFAWYDTVPSIHEEQNFDFKVDLQVIRHLWASIQKLDGSDKAEVQKLFYEEYAVKNIIWALRLKINFQFENEEIIKKLIYVTDAADKKDPLAAPAIEVLQKDKDNYNDWAKWKYADLLNPYENASYWSVDPRWIEIKNRSRMNKIALNNFHQYPMSVVSLLSWYKIKNYELSCIRTAVESLRLNIDSKEAMKSIGVIYE